ncbi:allophanate hydrolase, partial [Actinomadura adrarensis]
MSEILVHAGGLYTTVQDQGRDGFYEIGMPPSGAMDQYSYRVANMLVGNPDGAAALEATYIGPKLEFTDDRLVAVTGATAPVALNGDPVPAWRTL